MGKTTSIQWRPIPGYPAYRVSNTGRVQSCWVRRGQGRGKPPRLLLGNIWREPKMTRNTQGYPVCGLGRGKQVKVAHLVLLAFVGARMTGQVCRHLDGNPLNSNLDNLCWGTPRENMRDQYRHNTRVMGERHPAYRHSNADIAEMKRLAQCGMRQRAIARQFGTTQGFVSQVVNRKVRIS